MKAATSGIGDPQNPDTQYGPLADSLAFEKVLAMIARGRKEAELVVGGNRIGTEGCFIEPTVFLNPKPDAEIYRSEVFGPVVVVKTFDTEAEVIQAANDTEYGLMAGVFTRDINRALRVSARIDSGVVGVNCVSMVRVYLHPGYTRCINYILTGV
jgi:aldehyde dehydrogenase (NAD+)/retinal dehydrogenase